MYSERNATLTINSEAGRANFILTVSLDHVPLDPPPSPYKSFTPWPSQERRRVQRAEECCLAAEETVKTADNEAKNAPIKAEEATATETSDNGAIDICVETKKVFYWHKQSSRFKCSSKGYCCNWDEFDEEVEFISIVRTSLSPELQANFYF